LDWSPLPPPPQATSSAAVIDANARCLTNFMLSYSCTTCNKFLINFDKKFNKIEIMDPDLPGTPHGKPPALTAR
jgi:hypothetical protein